MAPELLEGTPYDERVDVYARTRACAHAHAHTHARMHTCTHIHSTHAHTSARTHVHAHACLCGNEQAYRYAFGVLAYEVVTGLVPHAGIMASGVPGAHTHIHTSICMHTCTDTHPR